MVEMLERLTTTGLAGFLGSDFVSFGCTPGEMAGQREELNADLGDHGVLCLSSYVGCLKCPNTGTRRIRSLLIVCFLGSHTKVSGHAQSTITATSTYQANSHSLGLAVGTGPTSSM